MKTNLKRIIFIGIISFFAILTAGICSAIIPVGSYDTSQQAHDVAVAGNYAYIADGLGGLVIVDITDPSAPNLAGSYPISEVYINNPNADSVAVEGDYAYVAAHDLFIVDITDPSSPSLAVVVEALYIAPILDVEVSGGYAYLLSEYGFEIWDISDPSAPTFLSSYISHSRSIAVEGNYAYLPGYDSSGDDCLEIVDISDPSSPTVVATYDPGSAVNDVAVAGNYAYLAAIDGLVVLDISDPSSPIQVGSSDDPASDVAVAGNYAYLATDDGLVVLDISDPSSPIEVDSYSDSAYRSIVVSGNYAYVTNLDDGLIIFQLNPERAFVTGNGWIYSPAGAYVPNPTLKGKATFEFDHKYKKGATIPVDNVRFQFKIASMDFKAVRMDFKAIHYDWFIVSGPLAKYKGTGTINGVGKYGFLLSATDGDFNRDGTNKFRIKDTDKFRIQIWDTTTNAIVYDNQMGDPQDAKPTKKIGGGSIVIQKAKPFRTTD
ncbi:MAG: hypothetical protein KK926_05990 [Methanomethylovorans sp.]|nr:hypothetical protein [Methanomethylovorans sp.]